MSGADVTMTRLAVQAEFEQMKRNPRDCHASLILDHGLTVWPIGAEREGGRGKLFGKLIQQAAKVPASALYRKAYECWQTLAQDQEAPFACWQGKLANKRLYLGRGEAAASVLETAVTLHPVYGVPYIPGSTLKGLARACAESPLGQTALQGLGAAILRQRASGGAGQTAPTPQVIDILFGRKPSDGSGRRDAGEAGHLLFHDAWWIPDSAETPLVAEVITVHHREYYRTQGEAQPADWDAPTPIPQIAVRGAFLFAVEGVQPWASWGLQLLVQALQTQGLGGEAMWGMVSFRKEIKL